MPNEISGYRIVEHLGHGAGSEILLVADPHSARTYALKRITVRTAKDRRFVRQAENEFAVASQLEHPYLRRCIAAHKIRHALRLREYHLVMEYVQGTTLHENRPTDVPAALDIFIKLARGLDCLHRVGYVHADMKPNNVLIGPKGTVKIIDFGQSCAIGHVKQRVQGTPEFIAPEQVDRRSLDQRTDVFNLGATLYWVLTGKVIPTAYMRRARGRHRTVAGHAPPPTPAQLNEYVPEPVSRVVMDCCQPLAQDRPASMSHLIACLDAVRSGAGPHDSSPSHSRVDATA